MPCLTYTEFKELSSREITQTEFDSLIKKASAVLNNITSYFYVKNDITKDNVWRVNQFKMALASQIDYFDVLGSTSYEEINSSPQSFTAGRTSVSNASRYKTSGQNETKSLVAEDVYVYLEGTGLLYAGVAVW